MIWEKIGKRVEKIRMDRKLSRAQFGKMIGVSGQHIGMVERGTNSLSVDLIVKICHTTGISSDYILFGVVDPVHDQETIDALNRLSHEQLQIVFEIIKKVAQFINTEDGNEALIREVESQQRVKAMLDGDFI